MSAGCPSSRPSGSIQYKGRDRKSVTHGGKRLILAQTECVSTTDAVGRMRNTNCSSRGVPFSSVQLNRKAYCSFDDPPAIDRMSVHSQLTPNALSEESPKPFRNLFQ
jgi:hypothetical protein